MYAVCIYSMILSIYVHGNRGIWTSLVPLLAPAGGPWGSPRPRSGRGRPLTLNTHDEGVCTLIYVIKLRWNKRCEKTVPAILLKLCMWVKGGLNMKCFNFQEKKSLILVLAAV